MFPKRLMVEDLPKVTELLQDQTVVARMYPFHIKRVAIEKAWEVTVYVQVAEHWINQTHSRAGSYKGMTKVFGSVEIVPHWLDVKMKLVGHKMKERQVPDRDWGPKVPGRKAAITLDDMVMLFDKGCKMQCPCWALG